MKRFICILLIMLTGVPAIAETERWDYAPTDCKIEFAATVERPENKDMPLIKARFKKWDVKAFEDALMGGFRTGATLDKQGNLEYDEPDTSFTVGMTDYGAGVVQYEYSRILDLYQDGSFQYRSKELSLTDGLALYRWDEDGMDERGELSGFSSGEAIALLRDTAKQIGIEAGEVVRYTAMEEATLMKCRDNRVKMILVRGSMMGSDEAGLLAAKAERDKTSQITLPEQGYLVRTRINYLGVPLTCAPNREESFSGYEPGDLLAYVTKDGVVYIETTANAIIYEIEDTKTPNSKAITAEQARDAMIKLYGNRATRVVRVAYEYVPVPAKKKGEYTLRPAWAFYSESGDPHFIDAYNGKEL